MTSNSALPLGTRAAYRNHGSEPLVTLQYFDGCPNWETTRWHLDTLVEEGLGITVVTEVIDSHQAAVERGFHGSPTVLIDGVDPFADGSGEIGFACRIYATENGPAGSPTLHQLRQAIGFHQTQTES